MSASTGVIIFALVIGGAGLMLIASVAYKLGRWHAKLQWRRWFGVRPPKFPPKRYYIEDEPKAGG